MPRIRPTDFVFQPVALVRPAEIVAFRIAEAIRSGDVLVGDRLPSEQALAAQMRVSRPTLRDAIRLLADAGVLQVLPGSSGGTFVISQSVPPTLCGLPLPELHIDDIAGVLEARRLFEPQVARLAAAFGTPADFAAMRAAVDRSATAAEPFRKRRLTPAGVDALTIASTQFNLAVARATQNTVIVQMMEVLIRRMEPVRMQALRELDDVRVSTETLATTLKAIESGDAEAIDRAVGERIGLLQAAWERSTGRKLRRRPLLRLFADLGITEFGMKTYQKEGTDRVPSKGRARRS